MRSTKTLLAAAAVSLSALSASGTAVAQDSGLDDMVGARAGQAEGEVQRRGYSNVRGEKGDDRSYTYWWNADRSQCVVIATMNGRFNSITPSTAPDCRQSTSGRDGGKYGRDRGESRYERDNRQSGPSYGSGDLSRICKNEAASAFDRRPGDITTNAPIQQRNGTIVQGWYDTRSKGTKFFNCRFDVDGRFLGVS